MKLGDRVILLVGELAGWHGEIGYIGGSSPTLDRIIGIGPGRINVVLDGEAGEASGRDHRGRGGRAVPSQTVDVDEVRPESDEESHLSQRYRPRAR